MGGKQRVRKGFTLITKLVNHLTRVLNIELYSFFEENSTLFEQDIKNIEEFTHEQYEVFKIFQKKVNNSLEFFIKQTGYESIEVAFRVINRALTIDQKLHKKQLKKLLGRMKTFKESFEESRGVKRKQDNENNALMPNFMYVPSTMESLVKTLLNLTEYTTFAKIMKAKVCHFRTVEKILKKKEVSKVERKKRKQKLKRLLTEEDIDNVVELYEEVKERLIDILPQSSGKLERHPLTQVFKRDIDSSVLENGLLNEDNKTVLKCITSIFNFVGMISNTVLFNEVTKKFKLLKNKFPKDEIHSIINGTEREDENYETERCNLYIVTVDAVDAVHGFINLIEDSLFEQVEKHAKARETLKEQAKEMFPTKYNSDESDSNRSESDICSDLEEKRESEEKLRELF